MTDGNYKLQSLENPTLAQWDAGEREMYWEDVCERPATPDWLNQLQLIANQKSSYRKMRIIDDAGNTLYECGDTIKNT